MLPAGADELSLLSPVFFKDINTSRFRFGVEGKAEENEKKRKLD